MRRHVGPAPGTAGRRPAPGVSADHGAYNTGGQQQKLCGLCYGSKYISQWNSTFGCRTFYLPKGGAYKDFRNAPLTNDVLPRDQYPMELMTGQMLVVEYVQKDISCCGCITDTDGPAGALRVLHRKPKSPPTCPKEDLPGGWGRCPLAKPKPARPAGAAERRPQRPSSNTTQTPSPRYTKSASCMRRFCAWIVLQAFKRSKNRFLISGCILAPERSQFAFRQVKIAF